MLKTNLYGTLLAINWSLFEKWQFGEIKIVKMWDGRFEILLITVLAEHAKSNILLIYYMLSREEIFLNIYYDITSQIM